MRLIIPLAPSINHCYYYKGGKRIRTKKARDYEENVIAQLMDNDYKFPDKEKIICDMWFFFPDNRRRDTHNTLKIMLDSIERGGLYTDDRYVLPRVIDWVVDRENPRVELEFRLK